MIGLMVLGGILIYLIVVVALSFLSTKLVRKRKLIVGILVFVVMLLIPTWDILPGYLHFRNLCGSYGGLHVYDVARVDGFYSSFTTERGAESELREFGYNYIESRDKNGALVRYTLGDRQSLIKEDINELISDYQISREMRIGDGWNIKHDEHIIERRVTREKLGALRQYAYFGGWVISVLRDYGFRFRLDCPVERPIYTELYTKILMPVNRK